MAAPGTSPAWAKACATRSRCAGAPARRACCTGARTSTRSRTSRGRSAALAGGTGLMSDTSFSAGTRSQPLGDPKAGVSGDLDALAAYVGSLGDLSQVRTATRAVRLTSTGAAGKARIRGARLVPHAMAAAAFTNSGVDGPAEHRHDEAQQRPTARRAADAASTSPRCAASGRPRPICMTGRRRRSKPRCWRTTVCPSAPADLTSLVQYLREIGSEEVSAPTGQPSGLVTAYGFNEGSGASATDLSGGGHVGTLVNGAGLDGRRQVRCAR